MGEFSEVHGDYERDTGCFNYHCMFPDCDGFLGLLELSVGFFVVLLQLCMLHIVPGV